MYGAFYTNVTTEGKECGRGREGGREEGRKEGREEERERDEKGSTGQVGGSRQRLNATQNFS